MKSLSVDLIGPSGPFTGGLKQLVSIKVSPVTLKKSVSKKVSDVIKHSLFFEVEEIIALASDIVFDMIDDAEG